MFCVSRYVLQGLGMLCKGLVCFGIVLHSAAWNGNNAMLGMFLYAKTLCGIFKPGIWYDIYVYGFGFDTYTFFQLCSTVYVH